MSRLERLGSRARSEIAFLAILYDRAFKIFDIFFRWWGMMKEDGAQSSELPSNSVDPLHSALGPPFFSILIENFANFRCFKVRLGNIVDVRRRCETPYGSSIDSKSLCKRFYDMPSENDDDHPTIWKHIRDAQRWFQQVILFVFEYLWIIFARFSKIFNIFWKFDQFIMLKIFETFFIYWTLEGILTSRRHKDSISALKSHIWQYGDRHQAKYADVYEMPDKSTQV